MRTIAHLSDLHFGAAVPDIVATLIACILDVNPDVIAVSGDLTQRARRTEFRDARAFLDALPGVHIIVPGNHDVPLYNVAARFGDPLGGFRRHISDVRHPYFRDPEIAVVGADTTRSFTIKDGGLRPADVRRVSALLTEAPADAVRVVVCHHPFDRPTRLGRWTLPVADAEAVDTLVANGADVFLTGHLHLTYVGHTAVRYQVKGRSAIVVEAGTATSHRGRGDPNSFNVLRCDGGRVMVERHDWRPESSRFETAASETFLRADEGWVQVR